MNLIEVQGLKKHFPLKKGFFGEKGIIRAVEDVSFSIDQNSVFALVGESGCGKSTVARLILRLIPLTEGRILFKSQDITDMQNKELLPFRRAVQIIFQDPFASLNPRMKIAEILSEPLIVHRIFSSKKERTEKIIDILSQVGLSSEVLNRYPHEFSGGQRQRICIARALTLSPELIIADEPLSALDVSIQAQIINLFKELMREYKLSLLFISHDLNVVKYLSNRIAIMYLGRILELGDTDTIFNKPLHPYTNLLLSAAPNIHRSNRDTVSFEAGEMPSPVSIPKGCPFNPRCQSAFEPCTQYIPEMIDYEGRQIACHLYKGRV